ncbi:MAG: hypothetical protein AVDCRST_MAG91-527, partial [uncultured Sphingomonadaceae bacterium]
ESRPAARARSARRRPSPQQEEGSHSRPLVRCPSPDRHRGRGRWRGSSDGALGRRRPGGHSAGTPGRWPPVHRGEDDRRDGTHPASRALGDVGDAKRPRPVRGTATPRRTDRRWARGGLRFDVDLHRRLDLQRLPDRSARARQPLDVGPRTDGRSRGGRRTGRSRRSANPSKNARRSSRCRWELLPPGSPWWTAQRDGDRAGIERTAADDRAGALRPGNRGLQPWRQTVPGPRRPSARRL